MKSTLFSMVGISDRLEQRFDVERTLVWTGNYWTVSLYCSVIYIIFIWLGRWWMRDRPAYSLHKPLILWNTSLAVFSLCGMCAHVPNLLWNIYEHGVLYTTCQADCVAEPSLALWGWLMTLSKVVELGDTIFIVLRKSQLSFLHWYHHITVLVYTWYAITPRPSALSIWFSSMNYTVHTIMYTYYALRASGYKIFSRVAKMITLLQLSQMFVGILVNILSWKMVRSGERCMFRYDLFYLAMAMYASYAVLFIHFFYHRYIKVLPPTPPQCNGTASKMKQY